MFSILQATAVAIAPAAACAPYAAQDSFTDPGPPRVHELEPIDAPEPQVFEGLAILTSPRPLSSEARVEDWPGFLGARREGKSRETGLLEAWPEEGPELLWVMERGEGYASPAVQGDRLVFTHREGGESLVDCLESTTGKRFWRFRYPTDYRGEYISNGGPCATPTIEGDRVWVHGVEGMLHCLELSTGRVVWARDLQADFELVQQFFGVVASPLLRGDQLILNLGAPGGPCVAAFDKNTGRLLWGTGSKWGMSCASPVLAQIHGEERLLVLAGGKSRPPTGGLMVIDPDAGVTVGEFPFRSRTYESVNGACPLVVGSTVVLTSSYGTGTVGVEVAPDGSVSPSWKERRLGVEFAAPVELGGDVYLVDGVRDGGGALVCLDPATGEVRSRTELFWEETVSIRGEERELSFGLGTGSLLHVGGDRFLALGDNGHLLRLRCTPTGTEVLDRVSLFRAGETWTPLVLSHGLLYVCQNTREKIGDGPARLYCYDLRGGAPASSK